MADNDLDTSDNLPPEIRLMNFVSEEQLTESRKTRGARLEDGTAQRDRSLYEILKENKDRKDAEFNERFKHRPPKALDEDETEFLDKIEMSRKEYEQKVADEEAQELKRFQAAVAVQGTTASDVEETHNVCKVQDQRLIRRKNPSSRPLGMVIKVKPQAKKAKTDLASSEKTLSAAQALDDDVIGSTDTPCGSGTNIAVKESSNSAETRGHIDNFLFANSSLVSYSDESEDDD